MLKDMDFTERIILLFVIVMIGWVLVFIMLWYFLGVFTSRTTASAAQPVVMIAQPCGGSRFNLGGSYYGVSEID